MVNRFPGTAPLLSAVDFIAFYFPRHYWSCCFKLSLVCSLKLFLMLTHLGFQNNIVIKSENLFMHLVYLFIRKLSCDYFSPSLLLVCFFRPLSQVLDSNKPMPFRSTSTVPKPSENGIENTPPVTSGKSNRIKHLEDLIRQGSAHTDLIVEAESQAELSRLSSLGQRDEYHQKLTEQQEEPCTYVHCKTVRLKTLWIVV